MKKSALFICAAAVAMASVCNDQFSACTINEYRAAGVDYNAGGWPENLEKSTWWHVNAWDGVPKGADSDTLKSWCFIASDKQNDGNSSNASAACPGFRVKDFKFGPGTPDWQFDRNIKLHQAENIYGQTVLKGTYCSQFSPKDGCSWPYFARFNGSEFNGFIDTNWDKTGSGENPFKITAGWIKSGSNWVPTDDVGSLGKLRVRLPGSGGNFEAEVKLEINPKKCQEEQIIKVEKQWAKTWMYLHGEGGNDDALDGAYTFAVADLSNQYKCDGGYAHYDYVNGWWHGALAMPVSDRVILGNSNGVGNEYSCKNYNSNAIWWGGQCFDTTTACYDINWRGKSVYRLVTFEKSARQLGEAQGEFYIKIPGDRTAGSCSPQPPQKPIFYTARPGQTFNISGNNAYGALNIQYASTSGLLTRLADQDYVFKLRVPNNEVKFVSIDVGNPGLVECARGKNYKSDGSKLNGYRQENTEKVCELQNNEVIVKIKRIGVNDEAKQKFKLKYISPKIDRDGYYRYAGSVDAPDHERITVRPEKMNVASEITLSELGKADAAISGVLSGASIESMATYKLLLAGGLYHVHTQTDNHYYFKDDLNLSYNSGGWGNGDGTVWAASGGVASNPQFKFGFLPILPTKLEYIPIDGTLSKALEEKGGEWGVDKNNLPCVDNHATSKEANEADASGRISCSMQSAPIKINLPSSLEPIVAMMVNIDAAHKSNQVIYDPSREQQYFRLRLDFTNKIRPYDGNVSAVAYEQDTDKTIKLQFSAPDVDDRLVFYDEFNEHGWPVYKPNATKPTGGVIDVTFKKTSNNQSFERVLRQACDALGCVNSEKGAYDALNGIEKGVYDPIKAAKIKSIPAALNELASQPAKLELNASLVPSAERKKQYYSYLNTAGGNYERKPYSEEEEDNRVSLHINYKIPAGQSIALVDVDSNDLHFDAGGPLHATFKFVKKPRMKFGDLSVKDLSGAQDFTLADRGMKLYVGNDLMSVQPDCKVIREGATDFSATEWPLCYSTLAHEATYGTPLGAEYVSADEAKNTKLFSANGYITPNCSGNKCTYSFSASKSDFANQNFLRTKIGCKNWFFDCDGFFLQVQKKGFN